MMLDMGRQEACISYDKDYKEVARVMSECSQEMLVLSQSSHYEGSADQNCFARFFFCFFFPLIRDNAVPGCI